MNFGRESILFRGGDANFFIFFSVCIMLIVYNFNSIFVIIFIFFISVGIVKLNGSNFKRWGIIRQYHASMLIKKLNEIIGNIKEVILFKNQNFFLEETSFHLKKGAKAAISKDFYLGLPAPLIEFFGILIFFSYFLYLIFFLSKPLTEIIVLLGVFAFASLKLLPNLINIIRASQNLKYNSSATNVVYKDIIENCDYLYLIDSSFLCFSGMSSSMRSTFLRSSVSINNLKLIAHSIIAYYV